MMRVREVERERERNCVARGGKDRRVFLGAGTEGKISKDRLVEFHRSRFFFLFSFFPSLDRVPRLLLRWQRVARYAKLVKNFWL